MKKSDSACIPMEKVTLINEPLKVVDTDLGKRVDYYLVGEVGFIEDYIDFLRAVDSCRAGDEIIIHINNYGGYVDTAINIYDALIKTEANVKASIEGMCASAASMIMLAANEWEIMPHATVMVHAWTDWIVGKWHEIKAKYHYSEAKMEPQFEEIYKDFLTPEEIKACLDGKDYWFDAEETIKRLEAYTKESNEKQRAVQEVTSKYEKIINAEIQKIINSPKKETKKRSK